LGTSGVKTLAVSPAGEVVARAEHEYPLSTPRPGWAEQEPEDWLRAAEQALADPGVDDRRRRGPDGRCRGVGVVAPGLLSVVLCTSGVVLAALDEYRPGAGGAAAHVLPRDPRHVAVMLSAARSLQWLRSALDSAPYEELLAEAAEAPPGCEGLLFQPYPRRRADLPRRAGERDEAQVANDAALTSPKTCRYRRANLRQVSRGSTSVAAPSRRTSARAPAISTVPLSAWCTAAVPATRQAAASPAPRESVRRVRRCDAGTPGSDRVRSMAFSNSAKLKPSRASSVKPRSREQSSRHGSADVGQQPRSPPTASPGSFHFVDRMKDVIRRRGENVSSHEVEQVLVAHGDVAAAAVFPVPSELGEDEVMACVVPRAGATVEPLELIRFCEPRLAYFAIPRYVEIVAELPLTATGKVEKFRLRERGVTSGAWDRERAGYELRR
jgi:hypothetical protein